MQCNYLGTIRYTNDMPNECVAGPGVYETSEEDRSKYCIGEAFTHCPRYQASLEINKSKITIIQYDKKEK